MNMLLKSVKWDLHIFFFFSEQSLTGWDMGTAIKYNTHMCSEGLIFKMIFQVLLPHILVVPIRSQHTKRMRT